MSKKVLLCDDEIHILRAAEIKVSRAGYEVRIAHDGQEAWELIQQELPDVLVTDVQMPRCDGLELSRRIRNHPATKDLPILMLTAKGYESEYREVAEKSGVVAILAKPFSPRELVRRIDQILGVVSSATS
jgi:two-component system, OmpR family, alkaline phosphatase synthesis response regulator PhoP